MADRYLLESGAPDGYLLEDGTGVVLLEAVAPVNIDAAFQTHTRSQFDLTATAVFHGPIPLPHRRAHRHLLMRRKS